MEYTVIAEANGSVYKTRIIKVSKHIPVNTVNTGRAKGSNRIRKKSGRYRNENKVKKILSLISRSVRIEKIKGAEIIKITPGKIIANNISGRDILEILSLFQSVQQPKIHENKLIIIG